MTDKKDRTEEILLRMLKENTGRVLSDSGDFYGRHWERNQFRAFYGEKPSYRFVEYKRWDGSGGKDIKVEAVAPLFSFLKAVLYYHRGMTQRLNNWMRKLREGDDITYDTGFVEYLNKHGCNCEATWGNNSYQEDSAAILDQGYQYQMIYCTKNEYCTDYVVLEIHNGCDQRGGYTDPKVFELKEGVFIVPNASIGCRECSWWVDFSNGYLDWMSKDNWNAEEYGEVGDLKLDPLELNVRFTNMTPDEAAEYAREAHGRYGDTIIVDTEGQGYCPVCGEPLQLCFMGECSKWKHYTIEEE
jgi:hypothetical protein